MSVKGIDEKVTEGSEEGSESNVHRITLDVVPDNVTLDADSELTLNIFIRCTRGCDLRGSTLAIMDQERVIAELEIDRYSEGVNVLSYKLKAPPLPGLYEWKIKFFPKDGVEEQNLHQEKEKTIIIEVKRHKIYVTVWDVPSPFAGETFSFKVGAKCPHGCEIEGMRLFVRDYDDSVLISESFKKQIWPCSKGLYWMELSIKAPEEEGIYEAKVIVEGDERHEGGEAALRCIVLPRPDYDVVVRVVDRDTGKPIPEAFVRLGPYRGYTGEDGILKLKVKKGYYKLYVKKNGYEISEKEVKIDQDSTFVVEVKKSFLDTYFLG